MMRHVAICNLPEPFAHPSLPRHPQMSDPPASISVELAGWGCAVFRSLSVRSPSSPFPEPSRLCQRSHLPSHLNKRSPAQEDSAKWSLQCVSMMSQQESIPATWGTRHKALRRSIQHVAGNTCCKAILCGHKWAAMNGWTILPSPNLCGLLAWDWISCCLSRVTRWRFHHKISQTIWWKLPQFLYARLPEWQHCRPAKWKQVCCKYEPAFGWLSNYFHLYLPWNKLQLHGEMLYSEARKCPIRTQNHYVNVLIFI